jgi:hypothetical protein
MNDQGARSKLGRVGTVLAAVSVAMLVVFAGIATAIHDGKGKKRIGRVDRSDAGATHLARAIFEGNGRRFVRAKFVTTPPGNGPVAIGNTNVAGFPRRGGTYALLSTGCARLLDKSNFNGFTSCANGGSVVRGAKDVTIWRIRLVVPRGANCLSFRFKFLSEEFPEFVGNEYNDAFLAEVGRAPRWYSSDTLDPTLRAPRNFAKTRDGNLISINATQNARVTRAAAKGTTYDAATGKLRASTRVKPGPTLLYLSILDQGDRQYDSTVMIDRLLVRKAQKCRPGVVGSG